MWLLVGWGIATALSLLFGLLFARGWLVLVLFGTSTAVFSAAVARLFFAKKDAMKHGSANAWFGLLQISAWDPTEGVLFLKDKMLQYADSSPDDGGGIRIVLPLLGEEEVCRVPLEVQTLGYSDEKVLTKEYVPLLLKGMVYWRIVDIARFYLLVSREVHRVDDRGGHAVAQPRSETVERRRLRSGTAHQLEAAEEWLRSIAEEQTRSIIARVHTGLLVADEVAAALPRGLQEQLGPAASQEHVVPPAGGLTPSSSKNYRSVADGLGDTIRAAMESVVPEYGIHVDRVSLQEARLPEAILGKAVQACTTAYTPVMAQRQATADSMGYAALAEGRKMYLAGEAEVIGGDAVAKREVLGSIAPFAFGGRVGGGSLPDFLTHFFGAPQNDNSPRGQLQKP